MFSCEQEARLVDHVTLMAKVEYGYTSPELCNLATEYAVDLGLREKDQPLSLPWYRKFITSCEKPRKLAIVRAKAASKENVTAYFQQLDKILTKYNLKEKPQHMYNIDEKGISENHNPPKVVGDKHVTPVSVTSGMSGTVTVL